MRVHKLMAILLAVSILVSAVPVTANAQEIANDPGAGSESVVLDNLYLDKTAELKDDGTYTINLEAYATGTTIHKTVTEGVPLDVVLVMDQSGSLVNDGDRLTGLKDAVSTFLEALRTNGEEFSVNHRVAICGFASYGMQHNSGLAYHGYSYANDECDNAWTNTGIFVNGEFKDYGTVDYIKVNSYQEIDLEKYADMCFVSRSRFIHLFKEYTGFSPYNFQLKIRMERAIEMLVYTSLSVEEIAEMVRYADCSYFCRVFKKFTGHTPLFYRK